MEEQRLQEKLSILPQKSHTKSDVKLLCCNQGKKKSFCLFILVKMGMRVLMLKLCRSPLALLMGRAKDLGIGLTLGCRAFLSGSGKVRQPKISVKSGWLRNRHFRVYCNKYKSINETWSPIAKVLLSKVHTFYINNIDLFRAGLNLTPGSG